ncbi:hypothetical protein QFC19_001321 [Naganishia cerealis]|uniref:Uncharacterized protein n=1 Tax=Naganishia cerealis TaxID=610337 RepID=A0ACC2WKQ9_9TREE|nr:hypothetical protein QFC19_001321 [Naganishia cerealis]
MPVLFLPDLPEQDHQQMVSMSGTSTAAPNGSAATLKKRTAEQAGFNHDHASTDGVLHRDTQEASGAVEKEGDAEQENKNDAKNVLEGKEWLLQQVGRMEQAFKEEAARNYVPPTPKPVQKKQQLQQDTAAQRTNGKSDPAPTPPTSGKTASTPRMYIDPRTGLPSPTQPTIHVEPSVGGVVADDSSRVISGLGVGTGTSAGKSPRIGNAKKSPRHGTETPGSTGNQNNNNHNDNNHNHLDSGNSSSNNNNNNNSKFPTGSAGDPIEIDDLDADVTLNVNGGVDIDMDRDVVHILDPLARSGGGDAMASQGQTPSTRVPANVPPTEAAAAAAAVPEPEPLVVQPEGIGLGLGGLGLGGLGLGFGDTSSTGDMYGLQGPMGAGSNDSSALGIDVGTAVAAIAEGGGANNTEGGETQISEEDLMKFFESLAPGTGGGGDGQDGLVQAEIRGMMGDEGNGFDGASVAGVGTNSELPVSNPPLPPPTTNRTSNEANILDPSIAMDASLGNTSAETDGAGMYNETGAPPPPPAESGMPEELDLGNLDWTQYSALLADDLGAGGT